jgi:tRNA-specific 2-thiouridylase
MSTQKDKRQTKVFVAISGGVDSSTALALLRDEGYDVTGVYFKTYKPDGNREYCRRQGMDAQAVCKHLGVPFKVFELEEAYREKVFNYMIEGYKAGITPNPDVLCNREIKFGVFAKMAFEHGADYIATGHYVRKKEEEGLSKLLEGVDEDKDQSYFLSQVRQEVLQRTLFPVGEYEKKEVRRMAEEYDLLTADKKDSQGICFIGEEIDVKEFLKRYIPEEEGAVLSLTGETIGTHKGVHFSTIGERHGFTINPTHQTPEMPRLFVLARDIEANTITVGTKADLEKMQSEKTHIPIKATSWISTEPREENLYECRIRHRGKRMPCIITREGADTEWQVHFKTPPYAPAAGQFLAVYEGDECLGGGIMV